VFDPFAVLREISKNMPMPLLPTAPTRILVPSNAVTILEGDRLIIQYEGRTIEYPIPMFATVKREILPNGFIEYIIYVAPPLQQQPH
jgi:hypothetical protein